MLTVLIEEEYGYRLHYWTVPMTQDQLIAWWEGVQIAPCPTILESMVPGSSLRTLGGVDNNGVHYVNRSDFDQWGEVFLSDTIPYMHLHDDVDSVLHIPGLGLFYHAGHIEDYDEE